MAILVSVSTFALDRIIGALNWICHCAFDWSTLDDIGRLNDRQHLRFWVCSLDKFQIEDYGCIDGNLWFHLHPLIIVD
ncbi:hypothetical protein GLOIN_2v1780767 [Rhizophagus irregularis DAOM 181602=DAOM 197198]|uniref:Uncharacterized protein n=1 Tax=Rhizophagus irregularis (strain DAOM 181602 / DAOM 197198 / MUCL 43194) TaxID=747089 RepID=A0A2P4PLL8_RHIID|nr:hypothetical protein GLOIN_2v1780767 [Rhizophagus irregularis DAOM 181602=DAOM 197198]POG66270.1 hypothetical protein GLOIN_2v1780767 [Rhizophagus irregularis DAOM 181602=DAOM 197198]|eukprot:XP_025173136.1 hypothetical protein GLOIN_2v1780767 [Rhizophagus irregularis DAOM 181602=DAOM 197198]